MPLIKKNTGFRIIIMALFGFASNNGLAQLVLTNGAPTATIDFSNSMQTTVGTNASTAFLSAGFEPNPTTAGRLNSNAWQVTGWDDGNLNFGASRITATTDYTRGTAVAAKTTGGIYAYQAAPASVGNPTLMIQPGGSDFAPGTITLRVLNSGTTIITQLIVSYNLFIRNDQNRANSFNFSYSTDNSNYTDVPGLDYTSTAASDALGWVQVGTSPSRTTTIAPTNITPGSYFYIRWSGTDISGSGSRDEFGLDDINLAATYSPPCSLSLTQASAPTFSNIFPTQMDVNFTRGNGSGVLIVASTNATLSSNPVMGNVYVADPNFGNGDPIGGGYVVFNGVANGPLTAANFTLTGLSGSTTYYLYLFEYDITTPCYLTPAATGNQATIAGAGTSATDYFQSRAPGPWSTVSTWQSSPDNATWITATLKPTLNAKSITIRAGHTVTITGSETAKMLNILAGGILDYTNTAGGGYSLDIAADPTGVDFQISGTYRLYGIQPDLAAGATAEVYSGGLVEVDGNVTGTSDNFAQSTSVSFFTGSIFDWKTITAFQTATVVYFPNASATDIPTFRISANVGTVGANSNTIIQGLFEVNAPISFINTGTKTFRNGIIGTAVLTQGSTGTFLINGATAKLGGVGAITLFAGGGLSIAPTSVTTLISDKTINTAGVNFTVDGTLLCSTFIVSGTCSFSLSAGGTLGIGSVNGIATLAAGALGNIQVGGARGYNAAANYLYNSTAANQSTGNGLPATVTTGGSLTISNTGPAGNNTVTLLTNNTTVPILNLANGLFEAGSGQFLKIAATGTVNGSGGNQGQSPNAGTIWFVGTGTVNPGAALGLTNVTISDGVIMGGANTTINGIFNIAALGFVNGGTAPTYSSSPASTLLYSCGCNYGVGNEWYANTYGTAAGVPHHVTLAPGTSMNLKNNTTPHEMRGDLNIGTGSTFALSTAFGGDLYIKGNWTRDVTSTFTPNTRAVKFNGSSGAQTITRTGGGTEAFAYMIIDKAAAQSVVLAGAPNATTVRVEGFGGNNILQMINGDLDLNQQTFSFISYFTGNQNNLGIDGTAGNLTRNIISTGGTGTFAVSNPDAVTHFITINRITGNASLLVFGPTVMVTTTGVGAGGGGINFGNTLSTVNGTLRIDSYGYVTGFAPTYGVGSFLVYNSGGSFDRNVEWGSLSGPGYPYHVTVQNGTFLRLNFPATNGNADRAMAGNLSINAGSSLLLATTANNTLTVGGNVQIDGTLTLPTVFGGDIFIGKNWNRSATGVFTPNDRAVFFINPGKSTITANNGQLFPYLYLTKTALTDTLQLVDSISISKEFGVTTGTFDLAAKNATLMSNATTGTADFGKVGALGDVGYSGVGRFVVERFIPTGVIAGEHTKSWQLLAVPDNGGQTINDAWQEGHVLPTVGVPGYGTIISSATAGAGFDIIGGAGPSMKAWDPVAAAWAGVANTTPTPLYDQRGYFIFVRGDRRVSVYNAAADSTTLRSKGKLFVPGSNPPNATTVLGGKFASIGNPYASAIDFMNISRPADPALDSAFYVWDPLLAGTWGLGGFQLISSTNGYKPNPGGTANYSNGAAYTKIQSGQAFLVHATGAGGTVSFSENTKLSGSNMVYRPGNANNVISGRQYLRAQLYTTAGLIADANVLAFDNAFDNGYDSRDGLKIMNTGENFAILSNDKTLSIEARRPVTGPDTVHYMLSNLRAQAYQLRFGPENMGRPGLSAWLIDRWLHTQVPISLTDSSFVDFSITGDPGSAASNRFILVFKRGIRTATNNPWLGKKNNTAKGNGLQNETGSVSIYPNPVVNKLIQLNFRNKPIGNYTLTLTNSSGQVLYENNVMVNGNNVNSSIHVPGAAAGYYRLEIIGSDGNKTVESVLIQ